MYVYVYMACIQTYIYIYIHTYIVEKSRAPRPYYVDHHEAVSHHDVTTDIWLKTQKEALSLLCLGIQVCPANNWLTASALRYFIRVLWLGESRALPEP